MRRVRPDPRAAEATRRQSPTLVVLVVGDNHDAVSGPSTGTYTAAIRRRGSAEATPS